MKSEVTGYSKTQIALHWTVVVLVAFQYLAHNGIQASWRALTHGELPSEGESILTYMHVGAGLLVLALMLARLYLRLTRGAPAPPADEPRLLKITSEVVHGLIYVMLLTLPVTGVMAWIGGIRRAAEVHWYLQAFLLGLIAAHIAGALFQHLVRRSDVMMRMFAPQQSP